MSRANDKYQVNIKIIIICIFIIIITLHFPPSFPNIAPFLFECLCCEGFCIERLCVRTNSSIVIMVDHPLEGERFLWVADFPSAADRLARACLHLGYHGQHDKAIKYFRDSVKTMNTLLYKLKVDTFSGRVR